jgi:hypothetical protein
MRPEGVAVEIIKRGCANFARLQPLIAIKTVAITVTHCELPKRPQRATRNRPASAATRRDTAT